MADDAWRAYIKHRATDFAETHSTRTTPNQKVFSNVGYCSNNCPGRPPRPPRVENAAAASPRREPLDAEDGARGGRRRGVKWLRQCLLRRPRQIVLSASGRREAGASDAESERAGLSGRRGAVSLARLHAAQLRCCCQHIDARFRAA